MENTSFLKSCKGMKLKDVLPYEFDGPEYEGTRAWKLKESIVLEALSPFSSVQTPWPGNHKNISVWVKLENGYAVGWNENPSRGWSFPVIKIKDKV